MRSKLCFFSRRAFQAAAVLAHSFAQSLPAIAAAEERNPSAEFQASVSGPLPNVSLPAKVSAPANQLTLFADYDAADEHGIPLYLVNRTAAAVSFESQDGDIYLKLEARRADGVWERAQSHQDSFCGNSYVPVTLRPGQHFAFHGYAAKNGKKRHVRFSAYEGATLNSNEGEAAVEDADIEIARTDSLSQRDIPLSILGPLSREKQYASHTQSPATQVAALRLLSCYQDNLKLKQDAQKLADQLSALPQPAIEVEQAVIAIRGILAGSWPKQRSPDALFHRCVLALEHQGAATVFGAPEGELNLVWEVLADIARREFATVGEAGTFDPSRWKPVMARMASLMAADDSLPRGAVDILGRNRLVDETLADDFFEKALLVPDTHLQGACAEVLSRRGHLEELVDLGWQLSPEGQLIVLAALARPLPDGEEFDKKHRDPSEPGEIKFWEHCLTTQPIRAACTLARFDDVRESVPFNTTVHDPLRDFLAGEAQRSDQQKNDFSLGQNGYMMRRAVEFLAQWNMEKDREVFQRLLRYRGYEKEEGTRGDSSQPYALHRYRVREAARRALLRQGVSISEKIVIEQDVTGTTAGADSPPPASVHD